MTIDAILERLEAIRAKAGDPEAAHADEDALYRDVLRAKVASLSVHIHVSEKHSTEWSACRELECSGARSSMMATTTCDHDHYTEGCQPCEWRRSEMGK
jgi:hypothetical protein